ncbi:MAG: YbjN domain-containing protein, partial [Anaerolineae bacterium]|nr:YbjN domain-containing protein [Anaerolineae bacterium]
MSRVSTKMIEVYLKRYGWNHFQTKSEPGEKEGVVITGWGTLGGDKHILVIDPIEEKQVLTFHVQVFKVPMERTSSEHLRELLVALGQINYRIILGKFSYDPSDGEVRFSLSVPTDNNTITYE